MTPRTRQRRLGQALIVAAQLAMYWMAGVLAVPPVSWVVRWFVITVAVFVIACAARIIALAYQGPLT